MIRLFFILYCFEAGLLLLFAPWYPEWDRLMLQLVPFQVLRLILLHPVFRGAVTGFGLVHLLWGLHDLIGVITRRPEPALGTTPELPPHEPHDAPAPGDQ